MLGIGLGSFVEGVEKGFGLRQRMDEEKERAADRADARKERDRVRGNREQLEAIETDARAQFDKAVEAGEAQPDQFTDFWLKFALPKRQAELLRQGDTAGAKALMEWGRSEDTLKGGRLFSSALLRAQTGDPSGALADAIEAGKLGGYIANGYEVAGHDELRDESGNLLGFRLRLKDADGNDIEQDVAVGDVGGVISRFLNPDAAWKSQMDARSAEAEDRREIAKHREKAEIDRDIKGTGAPDTGKLRGEAIKTLRERMDGGLGGDEPTFDSLGKEQQESLISREIELQTGRSAPGGGEAAPSRRMVVDEFTGKPVQQQGQTQPPAERPRLGNAMINGVEDPGLPMPQQTGGVTGLMLEGSPEEIARRMQGR